MTGPSPHEVLGVSPNATAAEIRSAFRQKLRANHPDTSASPGGDGGVIAVVEAYRQLMGSGGVTESPRPPNTGTRRHVEVRRESKDRPEPSPVKPCPGCGGGGVVEVRSVCPGCGGAGTITRLEAHHARVERCGRCRGRGGDRHRDVCGLCQGSGRVTAAEE
ncbi:MAG: J domain-containing protein [Acidimicrobiia bacterium]